MHKSDCIRDRAIQNIFNASNFAEWRGQPLNTLLVILLKDRPEKSANTAFRQTLHKYRTWLSYQRSIGKISLVPQYVYSHENPNNNRHVNCFLSIPNGSFAEFEAKLNCWIEKVQGPPMADTIFVKDVSQEEPWFIVRYLVKGAPLDCIDKYSLRELYERKGPQGTVYGQCAGFSRSLGPAAIKRESFEPMKYYYVKKKRLRSLKGKLPKS